MFRNRNNNYDYNMEYQRFFYEIEELNRKLRNLNNRLRRIESFLGLRNEDEMEDDDKR
ncbi:MAG: hypothetical protein ACI35W_06405 [Anaeroplasmataceae bacterium]